MRTISKKYRSRRGVAVAEAAFCIPMILLLAFGTLEICKLVFLKESITICAYEGARVGVKRRATRAQVEVICQELLNDYGIADYEINVSPSDFSTLNALEPITVNIQVPLVGTNSLLGTAINQSKMSATVKMVREFDD